MAFIYFKINYSLIIFIKFLEKTRINKKLVIKNTTVIIKFARLIL